MKWLKTLAISRNNWFHTFNVTYTHLVLSFHAHSLFFGILQKRVTVRLDATTFTDVIKRTVYKVYTKMTVKCFNSPVFLSNTIRVLLYGAAKQLGLSDTHIQNFGLSGHPRHTLWLRLRWVRPWDTIAQKNSIVIWPTFVMYSRIASLPQLYLLLIFTSPYYCVSVV